MPFYPVSASPKHERLPELEARLAQQAFLAMQPFGRALTKSLRGARRRRDGLATWEEDYCRLPLAEERSAVLDHYFDDLKVQLVRKGSRWSRIRLLPHLFPNLTRVS